VHQPSATTYPNRPVYPAFVELRELRNRTFELIEVSADPEARSRPAASGGPLEHADSPSSLLEVQEVQDIRQALSAGLVSELTIIIAPVILGGGKRLFDGFSQSLDLEHIGVRQSRFATFIDYRVEPS